LETFGTAEMRSRRVAVGLGGSVGRLVTGLKKVLVSG
jgi:hypothetical protein